jgi:AraC-like DNA-binding protein
MLLRGRQGRFPSLEQVASKLAMSSRNLRRKLGEKDVRFQDLLDDERRKLAEDYLLNSDMTIQQVSEHCGFNDSQNFTQAFRRWLGMSPMEFRNSRREK